MRSGIQCSLVIVIHIPDGVLRNVHHSFTVTLHSAHSPSATMPTFGGLLKKKKTKDADPPAKSGPDSNYQAINYKSSHKAQSPVSSKTATEQSSVPTSTTAPVTSQPDPNAKPVNGTNDVPASEMGTAPVADNSDGAVVGAEPRPVKGKYTLTDFQIQRTLGTGSFGRVHLVQSKHNQRYYAIKVLKKQQVVKMKQIEHTNDERRMLQRVKHPFLITLWGTFQDSKNLYMVMDFIEGGELFSLLRKSQVRPLPYSDQYSSNSFSALSQPCGQVLRCRGHPST